MESAARQAWQRARRPAERAQRRDEIVAAAVSTIAAGASAEELSMAAVATRAGLATSSLYTYFERREALLLRALAVETSSWLDDLGERLGGVASLDRPGAAAVVVASLDGRRPLIELMARAAQLMAAADDDELAAFKAEIDPRIAVVIDAIEAAFPDVDGDRMLRLLRATIVGLSTFVAPRPLQATDAEWGWFGRELDAGVRALLAGLGAD